MVYLPGRYGTIRFPTTLYESTHRKMGFTESSQRLTLPPSRLLTYRYSTSPLALMMFSDILCFLIPIPLVEILLVRRQTARCAHRQPTCDKNEIPLNTGIDSRAKLQR